VYEELGARYVRHRDSFIRPLAGNGDSASGSGGDSGSDHSSRTCQERRLTCIVYLNHQWQPEHAGHLRIYLSDRTALYLRFKHQRQQQSSTQLPPQHSARLLQVVDLEPQTDAHGHAFIDVAPIGNRLVIFDSFQVEHEVLASNHRRAAITTWLY
jgi:Rps23 Pro-64 3,4-dihydroxylase Tpa1-like proline 4-hydroxylase